jgi:hypothetical protein
VPLDIGSEVAALRCLSTGQLRRRFADVFGEATTVNNKPWLIKRIAWRLQALAEGDLSERARRRALELANDADLRLNPPRQRPVPVPVEPAGAPAEPDRRLPPPGTVLVRPYKGQHLQVQVLADGFAFNGAVYTSLSAVARAVTGSHCNGYLFFKKALCGPGGGR